jgi:glycine C-acetyltransferase
MVMNYLDLLTSEVARLLESKTFKYEVAIEGEMGGVVKVEGKDVVMLASNNYLGLSAHPKVKEGAIEGIKKYGYGVSSVRFVCGTQTIHLELEEAISKFVGTEDTILFSSCFAANEGFFASLVNEKLGREQHKDVIYSDRLNHASIIDGQRLCKPELVDKKIYGHADAKDLDWMLEEDEDMDYRFKIIATDGVFSMEGDMAPLPRLVELAREYNSVLFVDDSHAVGVMGKSGRGTPEELGVLGKVDVLTGTLGKAIGGAAGGYISGKKALITYLRQKSRPYTFSNSLPPPIVCAAKEAFRMLEQDNSLVEKLRDNAMYFRREIKSLGFRILEGVHPIVAIMLGEAAVAMDMSIELLKEGVYIRGLWYPVVPKGEARLRAQISAALEKDDIDRALEAFRKVGKRMNVV